MKEIEFKEFEPLPGAPEAPTIEQYGKYIGTVNINDVLKPPKDVLRDIIKEASRKYDERMMDHAELWFLDTLRGFPQFRRCLAYMCAEEPTDDARRNFEECINEAVRLTGMEIRRLVRGE